jgi:glycosyltransferase involved in cell wall biosynthesis
VRIAVWHNLPSGGGKRQLYNHVQGLLQRGHYVESWCPDTADQRFLPLGSLITEHIVPLRGSVASYQNARRPLHATTALLANMEAHCHACAGEIDAGQFDVLFANACMFLRTTPIARFVGAPSALYLGEPFRWFYEAMPQLPWIAPAASMKRRPVLRALRERIVERAALNTIRVQARAELEYAKGFDLVLTNSIFSRETILRTYNIESKVCYLGVDTAAFTPSGERREPFVVGLGTFYHAKGIDRAIRALGTIPAAKRPRLVWIGNGAWPDDLRQYERLATRAGVDFTAKVDATNGEVVNLLSRALAMIYTSRLEPFGLAPLEANACGTPVVGIAEGGIKETIRDGVNGWLASDDDPEAIGKLVERFVDSPGLADTMGARARDYVTAEWSLERSTDNIERYLTSLARQKAAKGVLADRGKLLALQPTENLRLHLEERAVSGKVLHLRGWAHLNDGRHATDAEIYVLLRSGTTAQLIRTEKVRRPDVTEHFGGMIDYDDSGFIADATITVPEPYEAGILVVRGTDIALQRV